MKQKTNYLEHFVFRIWSLMSATLYTRNLIGQFTKQIIFDYTTYVQPKGRATMN